MMHQFYRLTSGGAAYDLKIGFEPSKVIVFNKTKWASDGTVAKSIYHKGDTSDYAYNEIADDTGINRSISTSNGFKFEASSTSGRAKSAISAFTEANPGVGTVASTASFTTGDTIKIFGVAGMTELNNNTYEIVVINSTTFSLKDLATGVAVDTTDFTTYVAGTIDYLVNLSDDQGTTGAYTMTLGTDIIGSNSDVIIVEAIPGEFYQDLGDIG